ncbi:MAG: Twin-arginine translocation pathway signal [Phenylobacterium sp.]|nr:Twin-arginine translocation pathway signal [Phenylobacterium sp.]
MRAHRRDLLRGALGLAGAALFGQAAQAAAAAPRSLSLLNLHTGEALKATYFEGGEYLPDAMAALNHLLRDFRTGDVHPIAPGLLDLVTSLQGRLDTRQTVHVISGYRSPQTNAQLHERSDGVASHSLHMVGEAMDIRIPGVELADLRNAALGLQRGGVGYYPGSDFVHVDVGRVRRW